MIHDFAKVSKDKQQNPLLTENQQLDKLLDLLPF